MESVSWLCFWILIRTCLASRNETPRIKEFTFPSRVPVGDQTSAMCFAGSSDSPIEFSWLKNGKQISLSPNVTIKKDKEFSVIIMNPVSDSSSGNYTCVAKNSYGASSYSAILVVVAPPKWLIEPSDVTAIVGQDINVKCLAEGSPTPKILWHRLDKNSTAGQNANFLSQNGTLSFNSIKMDDGGEYECSADNGVSAPISKRFKVHVNGSESDSYITFYLYLQRNRHRMK